MSKKRKNQLRNKPIIKTANQINAITESGKYLNEMLYLLYDAVKPGVMLAELEQMAEQFLVNHNLKGAFKGFHGFPTNLCLSVNDCIVHGIPDEYVLKSGDLLKVDSGVIYDKGISDSAFSKIVGGSFANPQGQELIDTTKEALDTGLKYVGPGKPLSGFGEHVSKHMTSKGFSVIESLTGHGVGVNVHEPPRIYNCYDKEMKGQFFQENMVIALEPITAFTSYDYVETKHGRRNNGRNLYTQHGDDGAQREYMLLITAKGYQVLSGIQEIK